jgi:heat shock protein HtpX
MLANFGLFFRGEGRGPGWAHLAAVLVAPFAAMIVQLAISRTREYGADRGAAEISGNPRALASALAKLHRGAAAIPSATARRIPAAQHVYIVPGLPGDSLFSTHPDTGNRIAALEEMAAATGQPAPRTAVPVTHGRARPRRSALDPLA